MDSMFVNVLRGSRYMALELDSGSPKYSPDYAYVEIPLRGFVKPDTGEAVTKALRNQHLRVEPAAKLSARGNYRILIKTNPKFQEIATCPALILLDNGAGEDCNFYATFRKDCGVEEIDWAIRVYLLG